MLELLFSVFSQKAPSLEIKLFPSFVGQLLPIIVYYSKRLLVLDLFFI